MADLIALEWNRDHIRFVTGTSKSQRCAIEHVRTIPLGNEDDDSLPNEQELGERIATAVRDVGAGSADALVAVSRAQSELRLMNMPPAPDDELPDIVRFQALQQFTSLGESCPLDFALTGESPGGAKQVVAAAIPVSLLTHIQKTMEYAGLKLRGVVLRPCGTIVAIRKQVQLDADEVCLVVDRLGDEAELTAIDDEAILVARTVRLPSSAEHGAQSELLAAEVRRTLLAARTQLGGREVAGIVVCGPLEVRDRETLEAIGLPVASVNPFANLTLSKSVQRNVSAAEAERYVPLIGLLQQEASEERHAIDFLRPHRPAPPPDRRRFWTTAATLALTAAMLAGGALFWKLSALDHELAELQRDSVRRDKLVQVAEQQSRFLNDVDDWLRKSPNWLIELRRLSEQLPDPDRLQLEQLQADLNNSGGGQITIKGMVDESATVSELETSLRDDRHRVQGVEREFIGASEKYPWHFTERIGVEPADGLSLVEQIEFDSNASLEGATP